LLKSIFVAQLEKLPLQFGRYMTTLVFGVTTPASPGATTPPSVVDASATAPASSLAPLDPIAVPLSSFPVVPVAAGLPDEPNGGDSELPAVLPAPLPPTVRPLLAATVVPLAAPEPLPLLSVAGSPLVAPDPPSLGELGVEELPHPASRTAAKVTAQKVCARTFIANLRGRTPPSVPDARTPRRV
jgi:hypothetical protein